MSRASSRWEGLGWVPGSLPMIVSVFVHAERKWYSLSLQRPRNASFTLLPSCLTGTRCMCPFSSLSESHGIAWRPSSLLGFYFPAHLGGVLDKMAKPTGWESACISFSCHTFAWSWITVIHQPVAPIDSLAGPPLWLFILFHGLISPESLLFNIF